ncbi:hypothetical protein D3C73_901250 [compost metagenome]
MPAGKAQHTVHGPQQKARRRAANRASQGHSQKPQPVHLRQVLAGEPAGQIEQDGRPETGLHHTDQKTQEVQGVMGIGKYQSRSGQPPGHHDPADPRRRAVALQAQAARHLEQHVANEEHARGQPVGRVAQAKLGLHLGLGEADVDAVEIGEQETDDGQCHDAPGHPPVQQQFIDVTLIALTRQNTGQGNHGGSPFL